MKRRRPYPSSLRRRKQMLKKTATGNGNMKKSPKTKRRESYPSNPRRRKQMLKKTATGNGNTKKSPKTKKRKSRQSQRPKISQKILMLPIMIQRRTTRLTAATWSFATICIKKRPTLRRCRLMTLIWALPTSVMKKRIKSPIFPKMI